MKKSIRQGFLFYTITILTFAVQFVTYLAGSPQAGNMDCLGNLFFLSAAISHASIFALIPFALFLATLLASRNKMAANVVHVSLATLMSILFYINGYCYALYRFHINGMVISMFFGEGSDEIFQFDSSLYFKVSLAIIGIIGVNLALKWLANLICDKTRKPFFKPILASILVLTLFSNATHAYAAVAQRQSVIKSAAHLPYYFPITATRLMIKMGVVSQDDLLKADFGKQSGLNYPQSEISTTDSIAKRNILIIAVDSWNYSGLNEDAMPYVSAFAKRNQSYTNHLSSSNGTRGSIFGMFFGTSSYYWKDFDISGTTPVLINTMQERGYQINTFPSANLTNPNFAKLIFKNVPNLNVSTEGERAYDRDCQLTNDFIDYLDSIDTEKPFFAFLFYDLAHNFFYPEERAKKFTPSWNFADYMKLNNDMDPTPFWNLYLNCLNAIDSLIGTAIDTLESKGLLENTYIVITGDHGQEFNENHKNYWGHGSNYSYPQIHVPLVVHEPGCDSATFSHRTTHYDLSATLMHDVLGVTNPISDYSMGLPLQDTTFRNWHVVGDNLNFAFITKNDIIIEKKPNGMLDITDRQLNPIKGFKPNAKELNEAINNLNLFYGN